MADGLERQASIASQVASYAALPVAIQAGSGVGAVIKNRGIRAAMSSVRRQDFKNLAGNLKNDTFTKGIRLANEYDTYKGAVKKAQKLEKKAAKVAKRSDISLIDKAKNLFRDEANQITTESIKNAEKAAKESLRCADDALKAGGSVIEATTKAEANLAGKTAAEAAQMAAKASETSIGGVLKGELKNGMNIGFAALFTFIPSFTKNAIPAFKNDGFAAGMKETAKALGFATADLGFSAVATAIGGAIGGLIGTAICPGTGSAIGRTLGGGIASAVVSSKASELALKAGKYTGKEAQQTEQAAQAQTKKLDMNF